jgi:hypothetical protein
MPFDMLPVYGTDHQPQVEEGIGLPRYSHPLGITIVAWVVAGLPDSSTLSLVRYLTVEYDSDVLGIRIIPPSKASTKPAPLDVQTEYFRPLSTANFALEY